ERRSRAGGVGARAGRRERVRPGPAPSFLERYRTAIVTIAAVAIVAVAVGYVFIGSTSAAYTCGNQFAPSPTPPIDPGSSTQLGFLQDDMGNSHNVTPPQRYLYCPPASGTHYNLPGTLGPIPPRLYKPEDKMGPSNWLHNLEHGGLVVLYRNDSTGATAAGQQAFHDYFTGFPDSPICRVPVGNLSPVIARFDDMPHPFAALVWDRVFYFDTWDPALVTRFYLAEAERVDSTGALISPPEKQCAPPSAAPSAAASAPAASGSAPASIAPSVAPSVAPSAPASASPEPSAVPS
ncbi:MAG TPA: DUF3105 domain-containing protein, partial [Candidatus Limnocylindrales bacterium]|nr:DUF3105 domain-containing protein [Candidatus Limnocylindrales bacterium]